MLILSSFLYLLQMPIFSQKKMKWYLAKHLHIFSENENVFADYT